MDAQGTSYRMQNVAGNSADGRWSEVESVDGRRSAKGGGKE